MADDLEENFEFEEPQNIEPIELKVSNKKRTSETGDTNNSSKKVWF